MQEEHQAKEALVVAASSSQPASASASASAVQFKRTYYNHEEDRYSTCSEDEEEEACKMVVVPDPSAAAVALLNEEEEEEEETALAPNAEAIDCPICLMAVPTRVGVTLRDCLHSFCKDCLAHVIEFSDEAAVGCPYRDESYACPATIQQREIKAVNQSIPLINQ